MTMYDHIGTRGEAYSFVSLDCFLKKTDVINHHTITFSGHLQSSLSGILALLRHLVRQRSQRRTLHDLEG